MATPASYVRGAPIPYNRNITTMDVSIHMDKSDFLSGGRTTNYTLDWSQTFTRWTIEQQNAWVLAGENPDDIPLWSFDLSCFPLEPARPLIQLFRFDAPVTPFGPLYMLPGTVVGSYSTSGGTGPHGGIEAASFGLDLDCLEAFPGIFRSHITGYLPSEDFRSYPYHVVPEPDPDYYPQGVGMPDPAPYPVSSFTAVIIQDAIANPDDPASGTPQIQRITLPSGFYPGSGVGLGLVMRFGDLPSDPYPSHVTPRCIIPPFTTYRVTADIPIFRSMSLVDIGQAWFDRVRLDAYNYLDTASQNAVYGYPQVSARSPYDVDVIIYMQDSSIQLPALNGYIQPWDLGLDTSRWKERNYTYWGSAPGPVEFGRWYNLRPDDLVWESGRGVASFAGSLTGSPPIDTFIRTGDNIFISGFFIQRSFSAHSALNRLSKGLMGFFDARDMNPSFSVNDSDVLGSDDTPTGNYSESASIAFS